MLYISARLTKFVLDVKGKWHMGEIIQRKDYIDIVRGFAIICVIVGHCIQYGSGNTFLSNSLYFENYLFKIIYSFHMPLFMIVSGYLMGFSIRKNWKDVFFGRIKSLLIPLLSWAVVSLVLRLIKIFYLEDNISLSVIFSNYLSIFITNKWFLWAVFWCSLIVIMTHYFFNDSVFEVVSLNWTRRGYILDK